MKNILSKIGFVVLVALLVLCLVEPSAAQCAMCKASAEANLKNGGGDPRGLNAGILYMLMLPYLLVFGIGYWWWSNRRKERQEVSELSERDFV
ncbi:MAG: hypothetical protein KF734_19060 [Saprospiraceae bacterium]|nr:hypothetical protein [Saprospiraceae bacterium]